MLQDGPNLGDCDPGKPFHKLGHRCAILEVFKQCGHRYPSASEYPGSADAIRVLLDRSA